MKLNEIQNEGKWSEQTTRLNSNFNKINIETESLKSTYKALTQSAVLVVSTLPAEGEAYTIYRVVGTNSYTDYMYNPDDLSTPILMATYNNAIDTYPQEGSENLITSGAVYESYANQVYFDNQGEASIPDFNPQSDSVWSHGVQEISAVNQKQVRANLGFGDGDIDEVPVVGSDNLVKSGGVAETFKNLGILVTPESSYSINTILFRKSDLDYPYNRVIIDGSVTKVSNNCAIGFFDESDNRIHWIGFGDQDSGITYKDFSYAIPDNFSYAKVIWGAIKVDKLNVRGAGYKGVSLNDNWLCVSRCPFTFTDNSITIGTGTLYFSKNEKEISVVFSQPETFTFNVTGRLIFNTETKEISFNSVIDDILDTDIVLLAYNSTATNNGIVDGLLYGYYLKSIVNDSILSDNVCIASRASIEFPSSSSVSVGVGDIYIKKDNSLLLSYTHSTSETFELSGGSNCLIINNQGLSVVNASNVPINSYILLWRDGVSGVSDGLLYSKYQDYLLENSQNSTKEYAYKLDNVDVVMRAPISFTSNAITIGVGDIYVRNGNHVFINITHSTEETFTLSGSTCIVINKNNGTISAVNSNNVTENDLILIWRDGVQGVTGGLLYKYYLDNKFTNSIGSLITKEDAVSLDNLDIVSRAEITFNGNSSVTIGAGDMYIRKGDALLKNFAHSSSETFTLSGSKYVVLNQNNNTIEVVSSVAPKQWILLWRDGVSGIMGGLLYKYYIKYVNDNNLTSINNVINANDLKLSAQNVDAITIQHGATTDYPENTLTMFKIARKNGIVYWETDVRPCVDGYVLCHDDDIYKYAVTSTEELIPQGTVLISQSTVSQLKQYKFGVIAEHQSQGIVSGFENDTIPTLQEFLTLARAAGAVPVLEIKFSPTQNQIKDIVDIVKQNCLLEKTFFACYSAWENVFNYGRSEGIKNFFIVYNNGECSTNAVDAVYTVVGQYINDLKIIFDPTMTELNNNPSAADYAIEKGFEISSWTIWSGTQDSSIFSAFENKCKYYFSNSRKINELIYSNYVLQ